MSSTSPVIHSDPDILAGTPVFFGTRVPMKNLLDYLEADDSLNKFLDHFPSVSRSLFNIHNIACTLTPIVFRQDAIASCLTFNRP